MQDEWIKPKLDDYAVDAPSWSSSISISGQKMIILWWSGWLFVLYWLLIVWLCLPFASLLLSSVLGLCFVFFLIGEFKEVFSIGFRLFSRQSRMKGEPENRKGCCCYCYYAAFFLYEWIIDQSSLNHHQSILNHRPLSGARRAEDFFLCTHTKHQGFSFSPFPSF